jgi:hypothetical protein
LQTTDGSGPLGSNTATSRVFGNAVNPTSDVYHRPGGKRPGTSGTVHEGKTLLYRPSKLDCDVCPLKPPCCPKDPSPKIPRDIHEHARDVARSLADTEAFEQSRHERKKIEMRCAHLKRILKLGWLRLRAPRGAQDERDQPVAQRNGRTTSSITADFCNKICQERT